ncbi:MAG: single-stranded-DNA-specific exonuclease RecJ [Candidatus Improbicoccus pseudotrichonymphae]|uniref:Single-stranded-DNA-specific exonuclease RecJ n=1 Tax=Candidatus Improbicoccus pseudotrichonymphae TaxID=3033792 RepID=A0AA48I4T3_9FIRM|nr:MAG: single-stranded-DNA-specific exonuclease RecJ [Candidatus Improbicoccus pseudotrichonymphae]
MVLREWVFPKTKKKKIVELAQECQISCFLSSILCARGIVEKEKVRDFLDKTEATVDPFEFAYMDKFVERINTAIKNFEKICIYGDYDADGITSTVLMYSYLSKRHANVSYIIPSRFVGGYGLNEKSLEKMKEMDIKLIITVDNGVSAYEEIESANKMGMEVIIIDHHIPRKIPNACAIIVPKINKSLEFKDYAGVGVVFKAIEALEYKKKTQEKLLEEYGDLVAIGTIGDVVPVLHENRKFISKGLEVMEKISRFGTRVLLLDNSKELDTNFVSFVIMPKINSCGRMGNPETSAKLFLAESYEEAVNINDILIEENENRRKICEEIFQKVEKILEENFSIRFKPIILVYGDNWHHGVLGIVVAKIVAKYGKPAIVFSIKENEIRASARSIPGFSIFDAIDHCKEYIERFGGHKMATGLNMKKENFEKFREKILDYSRKNHVPNLCINIDGVLNISDINIKNVNEIEKLRPFGTENPEPIFAIIEVKLVSFIPVSEGKHTKIFFHKKSETFYGMYFNMCIDNFFYSKGDILDLAVNMRSNLYFGERGITICIRNIKYSSFDSREIMRQKRIFEYFISDIKQDTNNLVEMFPSRDDIAIVYKMLKRENICKINIENLLKMCENMISLSKLYIILEILSELGLADIKNDFDNYEIYLKPRIKKVNLENSKHLFNIKSKIN